MVIPVSDTGRVYSVAQQTAPPPPSPVANDYRAGDHQLSNEVRGTTPGADDQLFAMMANGAYAPDSPAYQQTLEAAGWTALAPHADGVSQTEVLDGMLGGGVVEDEPTRPIRPARAMPDDEAY